MGVLKDDRCKFQSPGWGFVLVSDVSLDWTFCLAMDETKNSITSRVTAGLGKARSIPFLLPILQFFGSAACKGIKLFFTIYPLIFAVQPLMAITSS